MPKIIPYTLIILALLALMPVALAFKSRHSKTDQPRIHPIQDMDNQPRYKAQHASELFRNQVGGEALPGTVIRPKIPGTVARVPQNEQWRHEGWDLWNNPAYYEGRAYHEDLQEQGNLLAAHDPNAAYSFIEGLPAQVRAELDASKDANGNGIADIVEEGKEQFETYCAVCHGFDGYSDGYVTRYAMSDPIVAKGVTWPQPANLVDLSTVRAWAGTDRGITGFRLPDTVASAADAFRTSRWQSRYQALLDQHDVQVGTPIPFTDEGELDEEAAGQRLTAFTDAFAQLWGEARIDSYVFEVISNGYNQMYGYKSMIRPRERWAIVLYVNALQAAVDPVFRHRLSATSTTPLQPPADEGGTAADDGASATDGSGN